MTNVADLIVESAKSRCDEAFGLEADRMREKYFDALGDQAPLVPGVTPPRAATPAKPGAIPRRVSGALQSHVDSQKLEPARWVFGIRGGLGYPTTLEYLLDHAFFSPIMEESLGEIITNVSDRLRGGAG